jgi:beta-galactosidase/beta-glucuronidase
MKYKLILVLFTLNGLAFAQWSPAGDKIKTKWASEINIENVLPEYPRPIMERAEWINLNGLWDYKIQEAGGQTPTKFDGKILVPFPVESSLSGVMKEVGKEQELWYETPFSVSDLEENESLLLHFGAVDWEADIWLNDIKIGNHSGGYAPFSFDITPFLNQVEQKLTVRVWDPTSDGPQPRGKQVKNPRGIWYTPVTGIWQTVWLEKVPQSRIDYIRTTPDIDKNLVKIKVDLAHSEYGDLIEAVVLDNGQEIQRSKSAIGQSIEIILNDPKLWSPENPHLYDVEISLLRKNKEVDKVKSYFAMRKISMKKDDAGITRMQLNNKDYFQYGTLDQGWWPDGLYTAPTDEALRYDILKTKEYGFNMIRKHVKVEPQRWYRHCDEIGMLVWQDMPNGDDGNGWQMRKMFDGNEFERTPQSEQIYRQEWKEIMSFLHSYPSIVVWVPFNEAWGQFKTKEIAEWTKAMDPSRLVNSASGGNHMPVGDILDIHNYPDPKMYLYDANRTTVLGEYGGIGLPLEGHLWRPDDNWGYIKFKNSEETTAEYVKYAKMLKNMVKSGFSGAIYTQTTDVEGEVNGLMTYDRKVDKLNIEEVRKINQEVIQEIKE